MTSPNEITPKGKQNLFEALDILKKHTDLWYQGDYSNKDNTKFCVLGMMLINNGVSVGDKDIIELRAMARDLLFGNNDYDALKAVEKIAEINDDALDLKELEQTLTIFLDRGF